MSVSLVGEEKAETQMIPGGIYRRVGSGPEEHVSLVATCISGPNNHRGLMLTFNYGKLEVREADSLNNYELIYEPVPVGLVQKLLDRIEALEDRLGKVRRTG